MAKATAHCKCKVCGAEFEKTAIKTNRAEADVWEKWAEETITLCPSCWGKQQREKEMELPLTLTAELNPYNDETPIILSFSGNTVEAKDKIKELGYYWKERSPSGIFGMLGTKACPKR